MCLSTIGILPIGFTMKLHTDNRQYPAVLTVHVCKVTQIIEVVDTCKCLSASPLSDAVNRIALNLHCCILIFVRSKGNIFIFKP